MQKRKNIFRNEIVFQKINLIAILLLILSSLTSCNNCGTESSGGTGTASNRIYFTSFPFNSVVPSVYSVSSIGRDARLHSANATIFSAPSKDGKLALLRYDTERKRNALVLIRTDGPDSLLIDEDNSDYSVAMPILSPDGRKIVFNGGNSRLYVWVQHNDGSSYIEKITSDLYENTLPSFSPDGRRIAFFEGNSNSKSLRLKVLDADSPDIILFDKRYDGALPNQTPNSRIDWTNTNSTVGFLLKYDLDERYIVLDLTGSERAIEFGDLGALYATLSPDSRFVAFTARNGQIWGANLSGETKYSVITSNDDNSVNLFQEWNDSANKLIFSKFYQEEGFGTYSTIFVVELNERNGLLEVSSEKIINNNAYKGFWSRSN